MADVIDNVSCIDQGSSAREQVTRHARRSGLDTDRVAEVTLVTSELLSNACQHGTDVRLEVVASSDAFDVRVSNAAARGALPPPERWAMPTDPLAPRGRGLAIVKNLADEVVVRWDEGHLTITARFTHSPVRRSRSERSVRPATTARRREAMHVLIAVDGSPSSAEALTAAAATFGPDATYTVLSVGTPVPLHAVSPLGLRPLFMVVLADHDKVLGDPVGRAEAVVEAAADEFPDDAEIETVVEVGTPGETICRIAEERDVDVVVVGRHERGWLSKLVEPSTSSHVVDHAPCHVLVVRSVEEDS